MALHDSLPRPNAGACPPVRWRTLPRRMPPRDKQSDKQGHEQSRVLWVVIVFLAAGLAAQVSYELRRELTTSAQARQVAVSLSTPADFASRWP